MSGCTCDGRLRLISMFDGIGGFPLAFSRAGVQTAATIEVDKAAAGVAADHFPEAKAFGDITEVTADDLLGTGFCPVHGIFSAGWPCTDLSLAGLRIGLGGARSGLVGEVFRLLLDVQPRWFVLENVPGLLSSVCPCPGGGVCDAPACSAAHTVRSGACGRATRAGRFTGPGRCMALHGGGMGTVLRRLVECGYGVAYRVLDAQHFGVPQRRRRVVIVGHLGDAAGPAEVLLEPARGGGHPAAGGAARTGAAGRVEGIADLARREIVGSLTTSSVGGNGGVDDNGAQAGHIVGTLPAHTGGGNGYSVDEAGAGLLVPTMTAKWAKGSGGPAGDETQNLVAHALTSEGADASEYGSGRGVPLVAPVVRSSRAANGAPLTVAPAITASFSYGPTGDGGKDDAVAAVAYALRADPGGVGQGHNTNYLPVPEVYQGHGSNVGPMGTLRGGASSAAGGVPFTAVRRLTPVECERLQGYPDGWTESSHGRPQADSARYRQLGNSIAVPVFAWVAGHLVAVDGRS